MDDVFGYNYQRLKTTQSLTNLSKNLGLYPAIRKTFFLAKKEMENATCNFQTSNYPCQSNDEEPIQ